MSVCVVRFMLDCVGELIVEVNVFSLKVIGLFLGCVVFWLANPCMRSWDHLFCALMLFLCSIMCLICSGSSLHVEYMWSICGLLGC